MENISVLLCDTISACVEEVDDQPFESRIGEVSCFALKKRSVLFTIAHQLTFSSKPSLKTIDFFKRVVAVLSTYAIGSSSPFEQG